MEQLEIREGDCVSVETGNHADIRRVSTIRCELKTKRAPSHHSSIAPDCQKTKVELPNALAAAPRRCITVTLRNSASRTRSSRLCNHPD